MPEEDYSDFVIPPEYAGEGIVPDTDIDEEEVMDYHVMLEVDRLRDEIIAEEEQCDSNRTPTLIGGGVLLFNTSNSEPPILILRAQNCHPLISRYSLPFEDCPSKSQLIAFFQL